MARYGSAFSPGFGASDSDLQGFKNHQVFLEHVADLNFLFDSGGHVQGVMEEVTASLILHGKFCCAHHSRSHFPGQLRLPRYVYEAEIGTGSLL